MIRPVRSTSRCRAGLIGSGDCVRTGATRRDRAGLRARRTGRGASWAGAGMLAPYTGVHGTSDAGLARASLREYPAFVERVPSLAACRSDLRLDGIVHAAFDAVRLGRLQRSRRWHAARGVACELLDRAQASARSRGSGHTSGALLVGGEGHVDNRRLGRALLAACRHAVLSSTRSRDSRRM